MIQVNGLTKDYGARRAIDNLTFDAKQGEIVGFLGPNGAGKTTTMRILTGYMPPSDGTATVAGYDVVEESLEVRKRVGYLPETVPLYDDMTALEYLKFMANLRRVPNPEERAFETLEGVNLAERADSYIGTFSKGMRQRVGLAQALIHQPEVLILDEPTIGLDPAQVVEIRSAIREIGKDRTVLLSTHILSEAQQICDRVLIINKGKIVTEDTPENLQSRLVGSQRVVLRVRGDSMMDIGIFDGDYVVASQGEPILNGDVVVAGIPGDEATVKVYRRDGDTVTLLPANVDMEPMTFPADQVEVFGRAMTVMRRL